MPLKNIPEQHADDILISDLFNTHGDKTALARLMGVSNTNVSQQFNPEDSEHPSDWHRARRILFAAYVHDEEKAEVLWRELAAARELWRDKPHVEAQRLSSVQPQIFNFITTETLHGEGKRIPFADRLGSVNELIDGLTLYRDGLRPDEDSPYERR